MRIVALFASFMLFFSVLTHAGSTDSLLIEQRRAALEKFNTYINMLPDSSPASLKAVLLKADSLLQTDNQLITASIPAMQTKIDTLTNQLAALQIKADEGSQLTETIEKYKMYVLGGVGLITLLMFVFLFLYIGKSSSSKKKLKKAQKEKDAMVKDQNRIPELESELAKVNEELSNALMKHKSETEELKLQYEKDMQSLKDSSSLLQETLAKKESELGAANVVTQELDALQQKYKTAEAKIAEMQSARNELEQSHTKVSTELNELRIKVAAHENQLALAGENASMVENLKIELQKLKRENNELILLGVELEKLKNNQSDNNTQYIEQLREKDFLIENLQKEMHQLKSENKDLLEKNSLAVRDLESVDGRDEEIQQQKKEIEYLEKRILEIEEARNSEYNRLKSDYQTLSEQLKEERERRVQESKNVMTVDDISLDRHDSDEIIRLRKELEEEKGFRSEVEKILEQLLKK